MSTFKTRPDLGSYSSAASFGLPHHTIQLQMTLALPFGRAWLQERIIQEIQIKHIVLCHSCSLHVPGPLPLAS